MTRSVIPLSLVTVVCTFSSLLPAQTETVINARVKEGSRPPGGAISSGWTASVNPDTTLKAVLKIDDPNLKASSTVDYELVITNAGKKAVTIPQTLDWRDVSGGSSEPPYLKAHVEFELSATTKTSHMSTPIMPPLSLYATPEKPSSALVLGPEDSIRLLGTIALPPTAFDWKTGGKATLQAHFCESSLWVRGAPPGSPHKVTSTSENDLWCVSADQKYEVTFPFEQ